MALLITVHNNFDLGIAKNILEENNVPYILNEEGAAGYLRIRTGSLLSDVHILVEKSQLEKAKDLIIGIFDFKEPNVVEDNIKD